MSAFILGHVLALPSRRESFAMYAMGILGDGERESTEAIASRAYKDVRSARQRPSETRPN